VLYDLKSVFLFSSLEFKASFILFTSSLVLALKIAISSAEAAEPAILPAKSS